MPKELEEKLKREANTHKDWSDERKNAYTYGALRSTGWKPKREQHGSLADIEVHEELGTREVVDDVFVHPVHKGSGVGFSYKGENTGLESGGAITWGALEPPEVDGIPVNKDMWSCNRDAGQGIQYGAKVDYHGPDTNYRAEEIDVHQYGKDYDPIPYRDYFKTEDKMAERTFRVREQDEYDETPQPGMVMDSNPMSEAYGAVNYKGAGPDTGSGDKAGTCDHRSFESQRRFARTNKDKSTEYAVDVDDLDTKYGDDLK